MSLWSTDSIIDVLKNLVSGLSAQWIRMSRAMEDTQQIVNQRSPRASRMLCDESAI